MYKCRGDIDGIAKYYEDNTLISDERIAEKSEGIKLVAQMIFFVCPYCDVVFDSKEELYSHIKENHNILSPIIIVNGKVVQDSVYVSEVESAYVFMYGYEVDVLINGIIIDIPEDSSEIDVKDYIFSEQADNDICDITVGSKSVKIIRYSSEMIDNQTVLKVVKKWENQTENGIMISMDDAVFSNGAEERYLQAFFNYFLACNASGNEKYSRYNDAYSILKEFNNLTPMGLCVMKIIAFRLNWIGKLKTLCLGETDDFTKICCLYEGSSFEKEYDDNEMTEKTLYVEDDVQNSIKALIDLYEGNYNSVKEYLSTFDFIDDIDDANLRDRVNYIWFKLSLFEGKNKQARRYYENILNKECFD